MANLDNLNLENFSIDELTKLEEKIKAAKLVPTGRRLVGLVIAIKEALSAIREIDADVLGEQLGAVSAQALPKQNVIGKRYNLSETEVRNASDKATKAIASL